MLGSLWLRDLGSCGWVMVVFLGQKIGAHYCHYSGGIKGVKAYLMTSRQNSEDQTVMRYQQYSYACAFGTEAGVSDQFDFGHVFVPSTHCKGSATPAWNNTLTCK